MSKENRKIALFLIGILFPVMGGILSGHIEGCDGLLLIGGIAGLTICLARAFEVKNFCKEFWLALLFAFVFCPPIFVWLNPHAFNGQERPSSLYVHTNVSSNVSVNSSARIIADTHTLVSNNWDGFIARCVSNRAWTTGMFMEEDIKAIIAECRQRERKNLWAKKRKNDGNGGNTSSRKLWWLGLIAMMMVGMAEGIDTMVKEWWKKRCAAGNRPFNKWIYYMFRIVLCCLLVYGGMAAYIFHKEETRKRHADYECVKKLLEEAGFGVDEKTWNKRLNGNEVNHEEEISR